MFVKCNKFNRASNIYFPGDVRHFFIHRKLHLTFKCTSSYLESKYKLKLLLTFIELNFSCKTVFCRIYVFYFLKIVIVLSQFYTQTTKCVIMPTLKVDSFATTVYLFYLLFTVTKAPGSFLAISADDQRWTFKLACLQCKTYPFIYNEKKFSAARIHLPNRYCGITCFTLLNKIHMGESVRILGDRCLKK